MKVIALETFSTGVISMFKGEIREVTENDEWNALIAEGLVEKYSAGGGGGALIIGVVLDDEKQEQRLDKTWKEIHDAYMAGTTCIVHTEFTEEGTTYADEFLVASMGMIDFDSDTDQYRVSVGTATYSTDTETGYPVFS